MDNEIDDNEFYQQDFTTASEWEVFNARLEEQFHEWKLPFVETKAPLNRNELSLCEWNVVKENVYFADSELTIARYCAKPANNPTSPEKMKSQTCQAFKDLLALENNFCILDERCDDTKIHPIARWYGLRDFVVVYPTKSAITNESQIRVLLSSIHIAVAESNCEVPVFVQVMEKRRKVYLGVCESRSTRLTFDIVHLASTPPTCKYLSGLLDMFKGKIGIPYVDPVVVSLRLTYTLNKFFSSAFSNQPGADTRSDITCLPWGAPIDPVTELLLYCDWNQVAENVVLDSQNHSDFDALLAPKWSLRARFQDSNEICYQLRECLAEYMQLNEKPHTLFDIFGDAFAFGTTEGNPLDLLTESKISKILPNFPSSKSYEHKSQMQNKRTIDGPIGEDMLTMLYFMFPDADSNSPHSYDVFDSDSFDPLKIKSAPAGSLVHRLSTLLAICNANYGGLRAVAQLWAEFTQEMRYRVERCIQIPGVGTGFPDSRTCLLHQKLQMLNVCMERRSIREGGLPFAMMSPIGKPSHEDSDDEFFDCANEEEEEKERNRGKHAPWNKPEGRLSRLGDMMLVDSDEYLYVPVTQEPVPKTEDQLEDDAEVMLKLGPGSELRAQMMSASLLSDMESFKAANPNGKIEDFIRWYSPRDWIEDDQEEEPNPRKGRLSSRMLIPGNTWQSVWGNAKPVPARRQKRLFDDAKEAEKVTHFLESRNIGQIVQLTLACLFHTAVLNVKENVTTSSIVVPDYESNYDKVIAQCCKLSRELWTPSNSRMNSIAKWEALLQDISNIECLSSVSQSLAHKLFTHRRVGDTFDLQAKDKAVMESLLRGYEAELADGARGDISLKLLNLFSEVKRIQNEQPIDEEPTNQMQSLPNPSEKQFTLRLSGKTLSKGDGGPQFLRAILAQNEFRLCGAFSQDTTFF
ncbi:rab3 GTPase-activating protein catalytic subunit isoform X2 [Bradysia coprophila]|uniref:rab3 GTPase-activating protein catalytic subunit isoform X2 n=1 Tax=Bradysia coprophila TaxID=38358 RepID=UPI00187D802D|nr:rab3 GTPase-activating protein catalytic subunit isoform X2 [Bradysia coprophila]